MMELLLGIGTVAMIGLFIWMTGEVFRKRFWRGLWYVAGMLAWFLIYRLTPWRLEISIMLFLALAAWPAGYYVHRRRWLRLRALSAALPPGGK